MDNNSFIIKKAEIQHIEDVTCLLIEYLKFYNKFYDKQQITNFILKRIQNQEIIIFIAFDKKNPNKAIGLAQLYSLFSTLSLNKVWVLNDLYVDLNYRGFGIGKSLIDKVVKFAKDDGAFRLDIKTDRANLKAQNIYEQYGFKPDQVFTHYNLHLN